MSKENNCNDKFDEAIAAAKELRGGGKILCFGCFGGRKRQ